MENEELLEKLQAIMASRSIISLREMLYGKELLPTNVRSALWSVLQNGNLTDYDKETFTSEILFWEKEGSELCQDGYSQSLKMTELLLEEDDIELNERLMVSIPKVGTQVAELKKMLSQPNFSPNTRNSKGYSTLHYATILGLNWLCCTLVALGADVNHHSSEGCTPIGYAIKQGRKLLLEMLIKKAKEAGLPYEWQEDLEDFPWDESYKEKLMYKIGGLPLPEHKTFCAKTQKIYHKDDCVLTEDGKWVHLSKISSLFLCRVCQKYFFDEQAHQNDGYCNSCAGKKVKCFLTGEKLPLYELRFDSRLEIYYKKTLNPSSAVRGYHSRPELVFYQTKKETKRFFGFELELVVRNQKEELLSSYLIDKEAGSELYMNRDGSLDSHQEDEERYSCGFELISHPMSLPYIKSSEKVSKAFAILQDFHCRSKKNSSTGLHIHVSREGFGGENPDVTLALVHKFIYADENRAFVEDIAGRKNGDTQYTSFERRDKPDSVGYTGGQRYQAINYLNEKTVEFRMFKGAIGREYLLEKVEFLDALITLAEKGNVVTIEKLSAYVLTPSGRGKWPNFARFLTRKNAAQATFFNDLLVA